MNLDNVTSFEPPFATLIEEVFVGLVGQFIVTSTNVIAADQHFSAWVRLVGHPVVALFPVHQFNVADRARSTDTAETLVVDYKRRILISFNELRNVD